jgi:hypothetical protein
MAVEEGRESSIVGHGQLTFPLLRAENLLNHQRINIHQTNLKQMQGQNGDLLIIEAIGRNLPTSHELRNEVVEELTPDLVDNSRAE